MARGWESKSVEAQIEGAKENASSPRPQLTPEQQQRARDMGRLKLSRAYVQQQMAGATNPSRIQALRQALQEIEEKLAGLQRR